MIRPKSQRLMLLLVLGSELLSAQAPPAGDRPSPLTRRILVLNDVDPSSTAYSLIDQGIRESLRGSKYHIEVYPEYMETPLFPDAADQKLIRDFYVRKYRNRKPDVIITIGSAPLRFVAQVHRQDFAGIPVVYCFPGGDESDLQPDPEFTGVTISIDAAATLRTALQMLPNTRHLFVITVTDPHDRTQIEEVKRQLKDYSSRVDITYGTGLSMSEFQKRVSSLPKDSIVLYSSLDRDGAGTFYVASESGHLISSAANAPVFSLYDVQMGYGQVGGDLVKTRAQGTIAGSEALKILDGASPRDIPVVGAPDGFVFDWRALDRWGIRKSSIPPDSTILNRPPTAWELYKWEILAGLSVIASETLLIFFLLLHRARARKAEAALAVAYDQLEREKAFTEAMIDSLPDIHFAIQATGEFLHWGRNPERIIGYSKDETLAMSQAIEIIADEDRPRAAQAIEDAFSQGSVKVEVQLLHRDGRKIPYLIRATRALVGNESLIVGIGLDITERKQAEAELLRLNRALNTIVECRRRMMQSQDERAMLAEVCEGLVNVGGYRLAWVGLAENDAAKSVRHVASAGNHEDYLETLKLTWADAERGHGPVGTAIRTGQPSVGWDIAKDARMAPWRDEALRHGFASSISLPLLYDGRAFGALTLYSSLREAFDDNETRLLTDLANDVAYGIQALRTRAAHDVAERALQESEARFRTLIEEAPIAVGLSRNAIGLYANKAYLQMYGLQSLNEVVGQPIGERWSAETRAEVEERSRRRIRGEAAPTSFEGVGLRQDGTRIHVHAEVTTVRLADGVASIGFLTDVTDQKRAEEALLRLRQAVDSSGEVVLMTNRVGLITFVNPQFTRLYGYAQEEVLGKAPRRILKSEGSSDSEYEDLWRTLRTDQYLRYEIVNKTKDGQKLTMECSANTVLDERGEIVGFISIQRDVTQRKNLEQQLIQAQKMDAVGQLAGGVAHDFNNLLGIMIGYADLTLDDPSLADRSRRRVKKIREAAGRAAEVTRQLLAFSRKQVLQKRKLDLNAVVHQTIRMLRRMVGADIEFITRLVTDIGTVEADPTGVDQVLMNLVINARDAMPDGGKLTIETANLMRDDTHEAQHPDVPAGIYVTLTVSDSGIGMDPEILQHIFEPFFTTKKEGSGTGLGLSTVYGIVQQSGGHVCVDSELRHGAKFTIYLPRAGAPVNLLQGPNAQAAPRGSETVLLVEDDQSLRQLNFELLLDLGYNVIQGSNAAEAIAVAEAHSGPIDLLMTDVIMPGMNGYKLAELLSKGRPELRVLFVSGYADTTVATQLTDSGSAFLQKPFAYATLAAKLREVLDARTRRRAIEHKSVDSLASED